MRLSLFLLIVVTSTVPASWCGLGAEDWFDNPEQQMAFARAFEKHIQTELTIGDFGTGGDLYNGTSKKIRILSKIPKLSPTSKAKTYPCSSKFR